MTIYFIDELGEIAVDVDGYGIQFLNGECYFSDGDTKYRVKVENIVEIVINPNF